MKILKMTDNYMATLIEAFKQQIQKSTPYTSGNTLNIVLPTIKLTKKIKLNYMAMAWMKMRTLVNNCTKEIAWQGVVVANEARDRFDVVDILVYPQKNAATTVDMDDNKYEPWHQQLDDYQYNNLRLQGHSHVNMQTSPSSTDINMYQEMLDVLGDESFYIFVITNKSNSYWYRIFDKKNNVVYTNDDLEITIDDMDLNAWYAAETKAKVTAKEYKPTLYSPAYGYNPHVAAANTKPVYGKDCIDPNNFEEQTEIEQLMNDPFYAADNPQQIAKDCQERRRNNNKKGKKGKK